MFLKIADIVLLSAVFIHSFLFVGSFSTKGSVCTDKANRSTSYSGRDPDQVVDYSSGYMPYFTDHRYYTTYLLALEERRAKD